MTNKKYILKRFSFVVLAAIMTIAVVNAGFLGYINPADETAEPAVQEANGFAPAAACAGAAAACISAVGAVVSTGAVAFNSLDWFDSAEEITEEQGGPISDQPNETLRESTHTAAYIMSTQNKGFFAEVQNFNSLAGGGLENAVMRRLSTNSYDSRAEAIAGAEQQISYNMSNSTVNLVKTHNTGVLSLYQFNSQLQSAGYPNDIKTLDILEVSDAAEWDTSADVIRLQDDITVGSGFYKGTNDGMVIDLNGYDITGDVSTTDDGVIRHTNGDLIIRGPGNITNQGSANAITAFDGSGYADVYVSIYNATVGAKGPGINLRSNEAQFNQPVFTPSEVASVNSTYSSASDVPTVTVGGVELAAVNVSFDQSYYNADKQKIAMPYTQSGKRISSSNKEIYIDTVTSGVAERVQPINISKSVYTLNQRDNVAANAYEFGADRASSYWNQTLSDLPEGETAVEQENFTNETGGESLTSPTASPGGSPDQIKSFYSGILESQADLINTEIVLEKNGNTQQGVIFAENITAAVSGDDSVISVNDTIDADAGGFTLLIKGDGSTQELNGTYTVTDVIDTQNANADSVQTLTYDLQSAQIDDIAKRLAQQSETAQNTTEGGGGGGGFFDDGSNGILIAILVGGGVLLYANRSSNGKRRKRR